MATATRKCKVCGKQYEYCHSFRQNTGNIFRWQDVACSPECGAIYLEQIIASRGGVTSTENSSPTKNGKDYNEPIEDDEDDSWFEKDFDEEDEENYDEE